MFRAFIASLSLVAFTGGIGAQREHVLHATAGRDDELSILPSHVARAGNETLITLQARFTHAAHSAHAGAWLLVTAKYSDATGNAGTKGTVLLRIPLSSTGDAYGESRSCAERKGGAPEMLFEAGLDEKNFIPFTDSAEDHDFRFLINKYLCRALAAPFHCGEREVAPPRDMNLWRFAGATVTLHSDGPATMRVTSLNRQSTITPFNYARCAVVAPSNGVCCVQHRTTAWHCGGKPTGDGWHQVSGDCYHRETGTSCSE